MKSDKDIRRNERTVDVDEPADAQLRFIGTIRTPWPDRKACPRQGSEDGPECRIEVDPLWHPALKGLDKRETVEVIYWLDRSRRDLVAQSPRDDGHTTGTFSLRSPHRPNPIGLSTVRLVRIEEGVVIVRGLDCVDGTPLLDIKPETCPHSHKESHSMTDADTIKRRLEDQRSALRAEMDALGESSPDAETTQRSKQKIATLEGQIREIEEKLERIALAEEMERQKDA